MVIERHRHLQSIAILSVIGGMAVLVVASGVHSAAVSYAEMASLANPPADQSLNGNTNGAAPSGIGGVIGEAQDHILIKFKDGIGAAKQAAVFTRHNLTQLSEITQIGVKLVSIPASENPQAAIDRLKAKDGNSIAFAEPDAILAPSLIPNDPDYSIWQNQYKQQIGLPTAWDYSTGDSNLIVAVADSGVNCSVPDLVGRCIPGWNFYNKNSDTSDPVGHGTSVAGIIGATTNNGIGIAGNLWHAKIMPLRVGDKNGYATWSTIAKAVTFAADNGAKVVNNSYPSGGSSAVQSAADYLMSKGGLLTVSEGNTGANTGTANATSVISVSGAMPNDTLYSWSSYGSDVDVAAPGCGYTTVMSGGYGAFCGTSNAAPEVAGVLGLIFSANPTLTPAQVENILFTSALQIGTPGWNMYYGWGIVNAGKALAAACAAPGSACGASTPDTQPPTVPAGLAGSAVSATQVNLTWGASTDDVSVQGYYIYRNGASMGIASGLNYSDGTAVPSTTYSYAVASFDPAGNISAESAPVVVATPAAITPPISMTSNQVSGLTGNAATIMWGTNIASTGFVSFGTSPSNLSLSATDGLQGTSHAVNLPGLSKLTTYYYKIMATSADGSTTTSTAISSFKTPRK